MTTDPIIIISSATAKSTEGYQSSTRIDGVTTSNHLYSHATDSIVSSTTVKATEGYHSNTRPSILRGSDETSTVTNTLSSTTVIVYAMSPIMVILLCLIFVIVKKRAKKDGNCKITVKKCLRNSLCNGHIKYRPVVDLDDVNVVDLELSSGHLLSTRDNINSLSDSDEEL